MEYIDVTWMHAFELEPRRLVSELDRDRVEIRKLEFFANGTVGFASVDVTARGTLLGERPVPELDEINRDPQFQGRAITRNAFEELWKAYARHDA
jgi:hypothetical protein